MTILRRLPELGKLNQRQVASLAGLVAFNDDSGKCRGQRHIRGGRGDVGEILYMAAVMAIRHNTVMKSFYERLTARGKSFKVAIVACMRKMLITLNSMLKFGQPWQDKFSA